MKALWAGLAFLMSISSAQACRMDSKFNPAYAQGADIVLLGDISQYETISNEKHAGRIDFARFLVTPKQFFSGEVKEPFWAIWRGTARFSPPSKWQGTWLMALAWKNEAHMYPRPKGTLRKPAGNDPMEILQDTCYPEPAIFSPDSPEAQAIIEVLGKQTEAEQ